MPEPPPVEFPYNLPVWNLQEQGLVIADFPINEVKGVVFSTLGNRIHAAYNGTGNFIVWDYENEVFIYTHLSGTNWATQFASITGSELAKGTAVQIGEVTKDEIDFRAIPADADALSSISPNLQPLDVNLDIPDTNINPIIENEETM